MTSENQLREFGHLICTTASGKLMSREKSCEAYRQVILNEQPELQQGAFLMAHITRGHPLRNSPVPGMRLIATILLKLMPIKQGLCAT